MKAERVARHLQASGIRVIGYQEGDENEDGFVMVTRGVLVQVATHGNDCQVLAGRTFSAYHFREDLNALVVDVRDALYHGADPAAEALPSIPARSPYEGLS